jgi:peptide/nickel transport system permease protein
MAAKRMIVRFWDHDLIWSLRSHPVALASAITLLILVFGAIFAPLIAPQDPYNLALLNLDNAELPPVWEDEGRWPYMLGTDTQGRDLFSALLYGSRVSMIIGLSSVLVSLGVGLSLGLLAGYYGGLIDNALMRVGDILLSLPTILIAMLVTSVARQMLSADLKDTFTAAILIVAISISAWVQYARTVRASTMVERNKDYVLAAQLTRVRSSRILIAHILPNTLTPVLVAATLNVGLAILSEATLSFLGLGMPATQPSLGTLIRIGNEFLFSGLWWIVLFPAAMLAIIVVAVNLLGDWLRDALNPKLR